MVNFIHKAGTSSLVYLYAIVIFLTFSVTALAQSQLDSNNYTILDPSTDSGGGTGDSDLDATNCNGGTEACYSLLFSAGGFANDARLTSTSYAVGSGFPNGIQANVPILFCGETDTNSGSTTCNNFPNANGSQGECGTPGCYDRAKIEIDAQGNPIDSLYLIEIVNDDTATTYYVQSDHTISASYDIADYMTICSHEGRDSNDTACDDSGDGNWDASLQSANVYNLTPGTQYTVRARALNGDITETQYSATKTFTTEYPTLGLDIDIGPLVSAENDPNYLVDIGSLDSATVATATDKIWLDLNTNSISGMSTFVKDLNSGLTTGTSTITSQSEDLNTDADGGYGLKIDSYTQTSLGPLKPHANYDTGGADIVGSLLTTDKLIFFTQNSGGDLGIIEAGRGGIQVKARSAESSGSGNYTDTIFVNMTGTF